MKLPSAKLLLTLASLALVLVLFALDLRRTSPGDLSPVHGQVSELAGADGCDACHGDFGQSLQSACLDCHAEVAASLDAKRGLHGTQAATDCARCHVEHHGTELELSGARAFQLAGIPDRERYDHAALGFTLQGVHAELACARCHANADATLLADGDVRFLGLSQDCAKCHEDPHAGRMARACADCHGQSLPFAQVATFEHGASFAGRGAHASAACVDCHPKGGPHSVEALGERATPPVARGCEECHASPHAPGFLAAAAPAVAASADAACEACHDPERGPFRDAQLPETRDWHAATGFALAAPHGEVACAACHTQYEERAGAERDLAGFKARYPGRKADDCAACHADPHAGQFASDPRTARGCLGCHDAERFRPARYSAADHARSGFALDGAHANAACGDCHAVDPALGLSAVRYAGTPSECGACHVDAHDGRFARAEVRAALPEIARLGCAACHDTHTFSGGSRERFDHGPATGFVVDGAHARVACEACHAPSSVADSSGRRFGRASEQFHATSGAVFECATCHADVHDGAFAVAARAASAPAANAAFAADPRGGACAACHTTERFGGPPAHDFDHGAWTGFVLEGAHKDAACTICHATTPGKPAAKKGARTFARAKDQFPGPLDRCDGCHADPHGGRFDRPGTPASIGDASSCARCHTQASFTGASSAGFDHRAWTGFALFGAHAQAACVACHAPDSSALAAGKSTLGRAPGTACADCHEDPHAGQFAESGAESCARCHDAARPFTEVAFDHQKDARFALDATHAKLACAACHVPATLASGARAVRYKPLGTTCADCHGFQKGG